MDEGGWFGVFRGKQDPYIKLEAFNKTEKTTVKDDAGKAATWNESFDFTYDTVLLNMHQEYKLTALDSDGKLSTGDDVIGTSNSFKVSQLLLNLGEEPIIKTYYLYNDQECRNVGNIAVKISWIRKLGDVDIAGGSLDIPKIEQRKA